MIDFNDTAVPTGNQPRIVSDAEREELRAELLARLESVLFTLFSAGKKRRGKKSEKVKNADICESEVIGGAPAAKM